MTTTKERVLEERLALLDTIVGRCVRDAEFASRVLASPEQALLEYGLDAGELDDFKALAATRREEAVSVWAGLRAAMGGAQK